MQTKIAGFLGAIAFLGISLPATHARAQGIGCEVILCLPVGFSPSECSSAKSYFRKAIRKDFSPFKPCKKVSASGASGEYNVPTRWFSNRRISCPGGYHRTGTVKEGFYTYCRGGERTWDERGVAITIDGQEYSYIYTSRPYIKNDH